MANQVVVTGAAGFIGSHLCEALLARGDDVVGVDCFTDYYPRFMKERNLEVLKGKPGFRFVEQDLNDADLPALLQDRGIVYHLAAQAGVRASWGSEFDAYTRHNISATQRLLEALKERSDVRLVFASSSSVYGKTQQLPTREDSLLAPNSPYGATKATCEHLCALYRENWGLDYAALRYFTVYGPRQRPDMGFHKFLRAILEDRPLDVFGDGSQSRDCTYVADIVDATILAGDTRTPSQVFNVGGGSRRALMDILDLMQEIVGKRAKIRNVSTERGDVPHTHAEISRSRTEFGYNPQTTVEEGLRQEALWLQEVVAQVDQTG
ncbi:MAG: putative UDP-glucose epimerase YtcB [Gemmatimonadota bacterium]|nr:MAG: putative UDP-glucose epimerase YtcB [Gemmatimonadota bacterium]